MENNYLVSLDEKIKLEEELTKFEKTLVECQKYKRDSDYVPEIEGWDELEEKLKKRKVNYLTSFSKKKIEEINERLSCI